MTQAFLIRIAMLTGVLMFGGVTWFLRQSEPAPQVEASVLPTLLWMARAVWAVAIVGCVILFGIVRRDHSGVRARKLSVIAWALGESVALLGGAVWFLTGTPIWYAPGVVFLVLTFIAFPARRG
ncbi:MAG: hypothetical protein Q8K82_08390 [Gemmatimonadaceae bacterium]|nr:hypothetical protein [Gemmatimonadaceae bacterium]